jgi:hypothetical protein
VLKLNKDNTKDNIINNSPIDPIIIVAAHKGYEWLLSDETTEKEAAEFEKYILNTSTKKEIEDFKVKKSLRDFLTWKYVNFLTWSEEKK